MIALTKHMPNVLTLFRLLAAPVVGLLLLLSARGLISAEIGLPLALALFAMACLSDVFDGLLARHLDQETVLGAVLDPIADKLLMLFSGVGLIVLVPSLWVIFPIALMIARDLLVGGVREAALAQNWRLEVRGLGKFKTVTQCLAFAIALTDISYTALGLRTAPDTLASLLVIAPLWLAAATSWFSGLDYIRVFLRKP
jgi:CDP-diacylglycerol--glycerol-3-phosphate 3-phosphatidyltransferase